MDRYGQEQQGQGRYRWEQHGWEQHGREQHGWEQHGREQYSREQCVPERNGRSGLGRAAVFLDRDGVIIAERQYLADPQGVELLPGAAEAIAALNRAGWVVVVVTNQSGVARGLFSLEAVVRQHARLCELLEGYGARLDGIYVCPHHPEGEVAAYRQECGCRKPAPGLLHQAAAELELDLSASWMIGDKPSDLQAGAAAGCRTALVRTGYGAGVDTVALDRQALRLEVIAAHLADAVAKLGLAERRPGAYCRTAGRAA